MPWTQKGFFAAAVAVTALTVAKLCFGHQEEKKLEPNCIRNSNPAEKLNYYKMNQENNGKQQAKSAKPPRGQTNPNAVLKDIMADHVKMDEDDIRRARKILENFVNRELVAAMKQVNSLFRLMFKNIYYTGSFFDGLRVDKPDEFDLDFILDLKLPRNSYRVVRSQFCNPGYVQLEIDDPRRTVSMNMEMYGLVNDLMKLLESQGDGTYLLVPDKIRRWIYGVTDKAILKLRPTLHRFGILDIHRSTSGPATTLNIELENAFDIDIDLVPVFAFFPVQLENIYPKLYRMIDTENGGPFWLAHHQNTFKASVRKALEQRFFIVPKPSVMHETEWRLDFHDAEIKIIENRGVAKPIIKLLKLFRSSNSPLECIPSYALKTVVMDMIRNDYLDDWAQGQEARHFLKALKHLKRKMEERKIGYFFDEESNILRKSIGNIQYQNMANFLQGALKKLEESQNTVNCRAVWRKYFGLKN